MSSTYGKTWDGKSRPVDDTYRQNYNEIFGNNKKKEKDPEQDLLLMEEQIQEIKRLRAQVGNLQVQIADYQQIVQELSDKIKLLEKNI
jgi:hypothetical protein